MRKALAVAIEPRRLREGARWREGRRARLSRSSTPVSPATQDNPAFAEDNDNDGDPEAAKALLEESGVEIPYPIKLTYSASPTIDKRLAVSRRAGTRPASRSRSTGLSDTYYDVISLPDNDFDVIVGRLGC